MSTYLISNAYAGAQDLDSYYNESKYNISTIVTPNGYKSLTLTNSDTVIYDLALALNKDDTTIDNDTVWNNIGSNGSDSISKIIIYANDELASASWKNIIFNESDFFKYPNFSSLIFDGPNANSINIYKTTVFCEITGWGSLSDININYLENIINLDISGTGILELQIEDIFTKIKSMILKNMNLANIMIMVDSLEYLNITDTKAIQVDLNLPSLKELIGLTPKTLKTDDETPPMLTLSSFKLPINLTNFPSNINILLSGIDYFPTGLDTIEKINILDIADCKNINEIRNLYINDCNEISLTDIYKLNRIKINNIDNLTYMAIMRNIDLVSLELPEGNLSTASVELYANINLSEIICNGISYGKEDSDNDLVALCRELNINLYTPDEYSTDNGKHRLGFNKLYINEEERNYYNINPQIYKNSELLGNPLTGNSIDDISRYNNIKYSYIKLPKLDNKIPDTELTIMLTYNVIDYNNNDVDFTNTGYFTIVAMNLNEYTAASLIEQLNNDNEGTFVFTNKPELLKEVKHHRVINPFTYEPDLGNVFKLKLVVY